MKKVLLLAATLLLGATMYAQGEKTAIRCQDATERSTKGDVKAAEWGTFTNFSITDLNGTVHNIQSYLDQGKYVVIDFFATWCGPCFKYNQAGILEALYTTYGQGGTGEFVVLQIEDDPSTPTSELSGGGNSQGDFTSGGTNPVPIAEATSALSSHVSLYEGYIPSVYLFCPSGFVHSIYENEFLYSYSNGNYSTAQANTCATAIYNFATTSCPTETSVPAVELIKPEVVKKGVAATFTAEVTSVADYTLAWTIEGGSPATATTSTVNATWNTTGTYTVTVVATNVNGSTTKSVTVNVVDCSAGISTFPFTEDFENGQGCWEFVSANTENTADYFGVIELNDGSFAAILNSYASASDYNQYLISPELHHTGELNVTFDYVAAGSTNETFKVKYSTSDNNPSNFTTIGSEITATTSGWATYNGTLPANAKYFMINYTSNYKYYLLIDDITFTAVGGGTQGINDVTASNVKMFPNPTTGNLYIEAEGLQKVEVIDAAGRVVMTETSSSINMSNLANGVYSVRVMANGNSTIQKVVKK